MPTLRELAEATPPGRDRYVDFLRAFSILTVVIGHYFIALIHWDGARIYVHNAVGHQSGLWIATWLLQVMPVFFFVGGFSNAVGWRSISGRGDGYRTFVTGRLSRLLRPTAVFAGVWVIVEVVLHLADVGAEGILRGTFLPFGPMWFLGVYVVVASMTPVMLRLHDAHGIVVPLGLGIAVAAIDAIRFSAGGSIGWLNLLLVWLLIHQLGFFYADGSLVAVGKRAWRSLAVLGLAGLLVLTNLIEVFDSLWYPRSMVGVDIEPVSNMSPPSLAIVFLALWQVGLVMMLRRRLSAWLEGVRAWMGVIAVNTMIMTVFLWHLTAFVVAIVVLHPLGLGQSTVTDASWWIQRPLWILAPLVVLTPLVAMFARFERPKG